MRIDAALGRIPAAPQRGPQELAYFSQADILGYGGAAGGGKSFLLLTLAATAHRRSLILRKEASQGRGLVDDARAMFGKAGRFNENTGIWRDLPDGRQIEFAGVKNPGDEQKHKGRPKDFLGIDEADQFTESTIRFLMGWVRTATPGQRCRTVLTFNPPSTAEGRWLLKFFRPWLAHLFPGKFQDQDPAAPGDLRWYAVMPDGEEVRRPDGLPFVVDIGKGETKTIRPSSRTFVPAKVEDNAILMATGYDVQLESLEEPLRSQLRYGDFTAGMEDDEWQVIPTAWVEAAQARWTPDGHKGRPCNTVGVDVARGGAAKTVFAKRHDNWVDRLIKYPGALTPNGDAVADRLLPFVQANPRIWINIDPIGVGASPYDECCKRGWKTFGCDFRVNTNATDATGTHRFKNLRAFAWWSLRDILNPKYNRGFCLPPDPELLADLTAPTWQPTSGGIVIEEKADIEERLGRSVDCGDSVVYSILTPGPGA